MLQVPHIFILTKLNLEDAYLFPKTFYANWLAQMS